MASRFWEYSDGKIQRGERQRSENRARIEAVIVDLDGTDHPWLLGRKTL
jgi:hypothetical protein